MHRLYPDFAMLLPDDEDEDRTARLHKAERIGRPVGRPTFLDPLERESGRALKPAKRGRKAAINALSP